MEKNTSNKCLICEKEFLVYDCYKDITKYCSKECKYVAKRLRKTNQTKEDLLKIRHKRMLQKNTTIEEREKLRLKVRNVARDHKTDYEKYKKDNPNWKAQKKISSAKHYQDNKEYYNMYNKLKRKFGVSPRIRDIRADPQKYRDILGN